MGEGSYRKVLLPSLVNPKGEQAQRREWYLR
jgi:hypothetical protein